MFNIDHLPFEILFNISDYLAVEDINNLSLTNKSFYLMLHNEHFWRIIITNKFCGLSLDILDKEPRTWILLSNYLCLRVITKFMLFIYKDGDLVDRGICWAIMNDTQESLINKIYKVFPWLNDRSLIISFKAINDINPYYAKAIISFNDEFNNSHRKDKSKPIIVSSYVYHGDHKRSLGSIWYKKTINIYVSNK